MLKNRCKMYQKKNKISYLLLFTLLTYSSFGYAQQNEMDEFAEESLKDASLVAWTGLGGAILGLSTLSFVEDPGDHLKNIYVGAAIGVVLGVGLVAYLQANKAQEGYESGVTSGLTPIKDLSTENEFTEKKKVSYGAQWTYNF